MTFGGPQGTVTALSFSRNGEMVAAGILNEGVRLWRTLDGGLLWMAASGNVRAVAFGPDSHLIANALDDQTIRLLDGETGHEVAQLKGHSGAIRALGFTTSGNRLVSVGDDKLVHIWSVRRQIPPTTLNVGRIQDPVKVNPDGTMLLTSTENGMKSWTTTSGLLGFERAFAPGRIEMQFGNNDGRFVLLNKGTDRDDLGRIDRGDLLIIDARTGREKIAFHPQGNKEIGRLLGSDYWISSDGRQAALVSSISSPGEFSLSHSVVEIWETNTGKRISSFRVDNAMHGRASVQFSPTGNLLALGIVIKNDSDLIRGVEIYDTTTGRLVHKLNINNTGILVFSPVGNRLALVEPGRIITIWDAQTGMKLISSHAAGRTGTELVSIAFSPDGSRMVSVSSDSEVWLWDTKSGKEMISLPGSSGSYDVRDIKVIAEGIAEAYRLIPVEFRFGASWKERSISFSPDGQKIILTTIDPDSKCITVRIETWDGSPRQK
jgi:WD40 repeat protein